GGEAWQRNGSPPPRTSGPSRRWRPSCACSWSTAASTPSSPRSKCPGSACGSTLPTASARSPWNTTGADISHPSNTLGTWNGGARWSRTGGSCCLWGFATYVTAESWSGVRSGTRSSRAVGNQLGELIDRAGRRGAGGSSRRGQAWRGRAGGRPGAGSAAQAGAAASGQERRGRARGERVVAAQAGATGAGRRAAGGGAGQRREVESLRQARPAPPLRKRCTKRLNAGAAGGQARGGQARGGQARGGQVRRARRQARWVRPGPLQAPRAVPPWASARKPRSAAGAGVDLCLLLAAELERRVQGPDALVQ